MMTFPRRILLAATGLSPQILTETLYALGVTPGEGIAPFIPTEVHLITTTQGADIARTSLLHPDGGAFHALLADYPQLSHPTFNESNIHIIKDAADQPLADIRSPEENAQAADSITKLMSMLTRDGAAQLHVSIAGGRKTMGFYLGYAFSLFARPQDELSHVLVSSPFESHPEFFFPPATPPAAGHARRPTHRHCRRNHHPGAHPRGAPAPRPATGTSCRRSQLWRHRRSHRTKLGTS